MDFSRAFDGIIYLFFTMAVLLLIFLPLGIWKAVELISYFIKHIHWS